MTSNPLMRAFAMLVAVLFSAIPAQGQQADASEKTAVLATVHAFFDTMAAKDAAGAERVSAEELAGT